MTNSRTDAPHGAGKRFEFLQVGRAAAAVMVVLYHVGMKSAERDGASLYSAVTAYGNAGVDLFFVISGFIIYSAHRKDIGLPERLPRYAYRRVTRIYPLNLILCLAVIPLYFLFPSAGADFQRRLPNILGAIFLLPVPPKPIIGIAWSLILEMLFYTMFGLAIVWPKWGYRVFLSWIVLCASGVGHVVGGAYLGGYLLSPRFAAFGLGLVIAQATPSLRARHAAPLLILGIAGVVLAAATAYRLDIPAVHRPIWMDWWLWLASASVIAGLVSADRLSFRPWRWAVYLGDASYSIYMTHWLFHVPAVEIVHRGPLRHAPFLFDIALTLVVIFVGSLAVYRLVEKPLARMTKSFEQRFLSDHRKAAGPARGEAIGAARS